MVPFFWMRLTGKRLIHGRRRERDGSGGGYLQGPIPDLVDFKVHTALKILV